MQPFPHPNAGSDKNRYDWPTGCGDIQVVFFVFVFCVFFFLLKKEVGPYHGFGLIMAVVSKTDISRKIPNYFKFVKKMNLNVRSFLSSQNIFHDLKGPKVKYNLH